MANINANFEYAHEVLQDKTIRHLSLIDDMIQDFKADVPDPSDLKQIFGNIGGGKWHNSPREKDEDD